MTLRENIGVRNVIDGQMIRDDSLVATASWSLTNDNSGYARGRQLERESGGVDGVGGHHTHLNLAALGGDARMEYDPDEAGHALTRRLKMDDELQFTLTRPINDAGAVLSSA